MINKNDIGVKISECLKHFIMFSIITFITEFPVEVSGSLEDKIKQAFTAYSQAQEATERAVRMENFQRAQYLFALVSEQGVETAALYTNIGTAALQAETSGMQYWPFGEHWKSILIILKLYKIYSRHEHFFPLGCLSLLKRVL